MMGEGMVLICTIAYGISTVLLKLISDRESPMTITAYQTLFGGALLIVLGVLLGGKVAAPDTRSAALLIYMALLSTGAFSVWTLLLKYNPVGKVAIYEFTIPIFGALCSPSGGTGFLPAEYLCPASHRRRNLGDIQRTLQKKNRCRTIESDTDRMRIR